MMVAEKEVDFTENQSVWIQDQLAMNGLLEVEQSASSEEEFSSVWTNQEEETHEIDLYLTSLDDLLEYEQVNSIDSFHLNEVEVEKETSIALYLKSLEDYIDLSVA